MPSVSQQGSQTSTGRRRISHIGPMVRWLSSASSLQATSRFFRRQLWAWPVIAALLLGITGYLVDRSVEAAMRSRREAELSTILLADVEALRIWLVEQGRNAELLGNDDKFHELLQPLLELARQNNNPSRELQNHSSQKAIRDRMLSRIQSLGERGRLRQGRITVTDQEHARVGRSGGGGN